MLILYTYNIYNITHPPKQTHSTTVHNILLLFSLKYNIKYFIVRKRSGNTLYAVYTETIIINIFIINHRQRCRPRCTRAIYGPCRICLYYTKILLLRSRRVLRVRVCVRKNNAYILKILLRS